MLNPNFVYVGILISAVGLGSYFIDTVKGKIKPNRISFALWSIAPTIAYFAEINKGVGIQSLMTLSLGLFPFIIFLGTFVNKKAYWKLNNFDISCGILSLVGMLLWYFTRDGNLAIFFSILADGIAYLPTLVKAYRFPETESAFPWLAASSSGLFTLLTVTIWNFANIAFPIYILLINIVVFVIVKFKLGKPK
jgi:hypothetical protein